VKKRRPTMRCVIVQSTTDPRFLSIRSVTGGAGGTFKRQLTAAGFEVGDIVTIAVYRGKITRPQPRLVKAEDR
jgi:hypothetical protein